MKGLLKAIVAGALLWIAINLVAMGYEPAKAESVIATVEEKMGSHLGGEDGVTSILLTFTTKCRVESLSR